MNRRDPYSLLWAEALGMLEEADRLQRQFCLDARSPGGTRANWEPPVDVVESADELIVVVALPGIEPDRIGVHFDDAGVAIRAERAASVTDGTTAIRRLEIPYGRFERHVALPPGRYEMTGQSYVNGCLRLKLHKT